MKPSVLGVIPARGGSKGVLRKNVRLLAGRPLIAYTVEAARGARSLTHFVTTTDDPEIAEVAAEYGSAVISRPEELARDDTPMVPVVRHALEQVERETGVVYNVIVLLQPTAPFRTSEHVNAAVDRLMASDVDSIISVYAVGDTHPARMYHEMGGVLVPYEQEPAHRLRQKMPRVYHRNGAVYACTRRLLMDAGLLLGPRPLPLLMEREESVNIDDELDFLLADLLMRHRHGEKAGN